MLKQNTLLVIHTTVLTCPAIQNYRVNTLIYCFRGQEQIQKMLKSICDIPGHLKKMFFLGERLHKRHTVYKFGDFEIHISEKR